MNANQEVQTFFSFCKGRGIEDPVVTHRSNFDKTSARTVLGSILFSMEPHCSNKENILYSWVKFRPLLSRSVTLKKNYTGLYR